MLTQSVCVFCLSVIAVIAATLFPLWPAEMRVGVYYLSVAAGCFVASILLLAVGKYMYFIKKNTSLGLVKILKSKTGNSSGVMSCK